MRACVTLGYLDGQFDRRNIKKKMPRCGENQNPFQVSSRSRAGLWGEARQRGQPRAPYRASMDQLNFVEATFSIHRPCPVELGMGWFCLEIEGSPPRASMDHP